MTELTANERAYMLLNRVVWLLEDDGVPNPLVDRVTQIMDDLNNGPIQEEVQKHD